MVGDTQVLLSDGRLSRPTGVGGVLGSKVRPFETLGLLSLLGQPARCTEPISRSPIVVVAHVMVSSILTSGTLLFTPSSSTPLAAAQTTVQCAGWMSFLAADLFISIRLFPFLLVPLAAQLGHRCGAAFFSGVLSIGKHAHTTAALVSIIDHVVLISVPSDVSYALLL